MALQKLEYLWLDGYQPVANLRSKTKVIELDGSYRRPRLSKVLVESVAAGSARAEDQSHALREAQATHAALQGGNFSRDNLSMAFPCREAVLRLMTVPFVGEDQIRKVIKFEAEGSIHSHNVDDMVVDFHKLGESATETRVLMAGLPKAPLRTALDALEHAGIEPMVVDLDTMALYRVAQWCGAFGPVSDTDTDGVGDVLSSRFVRQAFSNASRSSISIWYQSRVMVTLSSGSATNPNV